jgi:hypothetical protein
MGYAAAGAFFFELFPIPINPLVEKYTFQIIGPVIEHDIDHLRNRMTPAPLRSHSLPK